LADNNTVLAQLLKFTPRWSLLREVLWYEFEPLVKQHHAGRSFRTAFRWVQFVSMAMAQLSGRNSLRDIVENVSAQTHHELYEALFGKLLQRCHGIVPGHNFRFNHPLYSLGASTINLCSSVFPWADFRTTKGAIKLHVGLNHAGYLPDL